MEQDTACARYGADVVEEGSDFWLIEVTVNDTATGDHPISLLERDGTPSATANVTLLHRTNGEFVAAYDAVGGIVSMTVTPSTNEAKDGLALQGSIEADFPSHALRELRCMGGVAADGGLASSTCVCAEADGTKSTCVSMNGSNCCHDLGSSRIHVHIPFNAASCPNMCRWAAGLPVDYCYQVFGK